MFIYLIKTLTLIDDMSRSRSSFKVKCQIEGHNLKLGMFIHLIKTLILRGEMSKSRSSFKVKGQIEGKKMQL